MKRRITGAITFLGGLGTVIAMMDNISLGNVTEEGFFAVSGLIIVGVSAILYVYWTEFGGDPETSKEERENKLLRSKIEQKKLRKDLEED